MAVIMIENDKKDNEDERKYKKSRGTTGALQPRMLLAYVLVFLILCWKSQLDGRRSHDDGETGAALSGTICWEIIVLIFHPLLPHSPPLLSWHTRLHCLCWAAVKKTQFPRKSYFAAMAFSFNLFVWDYMRNAVITWLWTLRGEKNFNIMFTIITIMCAIRYEDECWFFRPISISSTIWKENMWWLFRVKLSTLSNSEFV